LTNDNHHWNYVEGGKIELRVIISTEFRGLFENAVKLASDELKMVDDIDEEIYKTIKTEQKYIGKIVQILGTTKDKHHIMIECKDVFYKSNFDELIDTQRILLCFTKGIFDFNTLKFRDGKPEDMCSMCTNTPMLPITTEEMVYMDQIERRMFYDPLGEEVGNYL